MPVNSTQRWILFTIICVLFLLIGIAAIVTVLGGFEKADPDFRKFAIGVLFADIAGAVITAFKFIFVTDRVVLVNLTFKGTPATQISPVSGQFVAFDVSVKQVAADDMRLSHGRGGHTAQFKLRPGDVDHILLSVVDGTGKVWKSSTVPLNELDATLV
jgi:hypothetical protein